MSGLWKAVQQFVKATGPIRILIVLGTFLSVFWGVWAGAFPMPERLLSVAKPLGSLSTVAGALVGARARPSRPVRSAVGSLVIAWLLFLTNYLASNLLQGHGEPWITLVDALQATTFMGFFFYVALAFALCVRSLPACTAAGPPESRPPAAA